MTLEVEFHDAWRLAHYQLTELRPLLGTESCVLSIVKLSRHSSGVEKTLIEGNFVIAATPVLGFFFYVVGATLANAWWRREDSAAYLGGQVEEFWPYLGRRVRRNLIVVSFGIVFLAVCLLLPGVSDLLPAIREMKSPGLILLAVLIVALAAYWLWRGFNQANWQVRDKGVAFATAFFSSGNVNLSIAMLAPFASTVLIILFDRFLKLVA